ncbi:MAG TPA: hypothetical protein VG502_03875 [Flexivirga sp.]|uniref:hypothetical protein n=1 Tax=Flexivirga sp. TaxID=1962927 RepID=UPI002B620703|nr:hypothetical protein [Flexivirga sp.]HWC21418.1 hypothetical protein [Flexivirga sp.]
MTSTDRSLADRMDAARRIAVAHADSSQVVVRRLQVEETPAACALLTEIWAPGKGRPPLEASLLIALLHSDNYVAGAFARQHLVGVCVGFCTSPAASGLHSHIAGVRTAHSGHGVGLALKLHQRAWALGRGISTVSWTYDPLVARNAYFNLRRLGADAVDYIPDFYGAMSDGLNKGQHSDRMVVQWDIARWPPPEPAENLEVPPVLEVGRARQPVLVDLPDTASVCRLAIPDDISALRTYDVELAESWRHATRDAFLGLIQNGWQVTGFDRAGFYLLEMALV